MLDFLLPPSARLCYNFSCIALNKGCVSLILGILSIIAGIFIFLQASRLNVISTLITSVSDTAATFMVVAVCLLISGILAIIYSVKPNRQAMIGCIATNAIASFVGFNNSVGDMQIWKYVCLLLMVYYFCKLKREWTKIDPKSFDQSISDCGMPADGEYKNEDEKHISS